jgi:dolichol-phosphate mannosyltransferase
LNPIVVTPTYNEAENLPHLLRSIEAAWSGLPVLVVDDASPDGTADLAESLRDQYPSLRVLRRTGERGLGRAYVDGFRQVLAEGFDRVIQMDADGSHDPFRLTDLIRATDVAGLAIGSRYCNGGAVENWPPRRVLLSRCANRYVRLVSGVPVADATAGYRCWTEKALRAIDLETVASRGYAFQIEMTYRAMRAGARIAEVPITFTDRVRGQSKMSGKVIGEALLVPWRLRFSGWSPALREAVVQVSASEEMREPVSIAKR